MPLRQRTLVARRLFRNMTDAEKRLWAALRELPAGHRLRRQHPIGPYGANDDHYSDEAAARRRDETIRRMIATPPRPHRAPGGKDATKDAWKAASKRPIRRRGRKAAQGAPFIVDS